MILDNNQILPRKTGSANTTGAGATLVQAAASGKAIHLVDLINGDGSNMASLKYHGATGELIAQVGAGSAISLNAPIKVPSRKATVNNASGYSVANGVSVTVDALAKAIPSGDILYFTNGGVLTLTSGAAAGATTLAGNLTVANIVDNEVGQTKAKIHVATSTKFTATYTEEV